MKPELVPIPILQDPLGFIGVVEGARALPFPVKRFYFIGGIAEGASRGSHAHRILRQVIVALAGSVVVDLDDGNAIEEFVLGGPSVGLVVPPGYWRTLRDFAPQTLIGVLASEEYDESDYIRNYDDFVEWAREG